MREIKFRAWDVNLKKMIIFNGDWSYWGDCILSFSDSDGNSLGSLFNIMQFTGLKDKNGVEIYEGDVVEIIDATDGNFVTIIKRRCKVVYQGVSFQYVPIPESNYTNSMIGVEVEILGNIHENPELAK